MLTKAHIYIQLQASIPNLLTILRLLANWPCLKFSDISTKFLYMAFTSTETKQYFIDISGIHITKLTVCKHAKKITQIFRIIIFVDGVHLNFLCTNYMQWPFQPLKRPPPCCLKMLDTKLSSLPVTWYHIPREQRPQLHFYNTLKTPNFCKAFDVSMAIVIWYLMILCLEDEPNITSWSKGTVTTIIWVTVVYFTIYFD